MKRDDIAQVAKAHKIRRVRNDAGKLDLSENTYEFAEAITFFAGNEYHQLIKHLVRGLIETKTRPAYESAIIAAVYLREAKELYGLKDYQP